MTGPDHATRTVAPTLAHLEVPIASLRPHPRNPRRGDLEAIKDSLRHHGQYRPVVANRRTGEVLARKTTSTARPASSASQRSPLRSSTSPRRRRPSSSSSTTAPRTSPAYDDALLLELLEGLGDLSGTGFDDQALESLLDEVAPPPYEDEELPAAPREPETRPGDLYGLGSHRLLCGDATDATDLERLMGAEQAALLWTDPPYGVAYEGRTAARLRLRNDRFDLADALREGSASISSIPPSGRTTPTRARRTNLGCAAAF